MSQSNRSSQAKTGVRFTLRKRAIRNVSDNVNISSYNSDFLSGLFSDVAKISVLSDDQETGSKRNAADMTGEPVTHPSVIAPDTPNKKRRTIMNHGLSRSSFSIGNLSDLDSVQSPVRCAPSNDGSSSEFTEKQLPLHLTIKEPVTSSKSLKDCKHHDSLAFQLNCVSGDGTKSRSTNSTAKVAFPNLPATVSDSSCSTGLTRANLIKQKSSPGNQNKESFGWFVDLDDHHTVDTSASLPYTVSNDSLAFKAPTAPRSNINDAEVQWAKAADTVDDVLGAFF